eukprot:1152208-Pelagomonas_calceolata.AAC.3
MMSEHRQGVSLQKWRLRLRMDCCASLFKHFVSSRIRMYCPAYLDAYPPRAPVFYLSKQLFFFLSLLL